MHNRNNPTSPDANATLFWKSFMCVTVFLAQDSSFRSKALSCNHMTETHDHHNILTTHDCLRVSNRSRTFWCLISFLRSIPHVRCLHGRGMAARWTWNRCFRLRAWQTSTEKQRFSSAKFFRGGCFLRETTQSVCFSSSGLIGGTFLVWLSVSITLRWTPESMEKPHRPFESVHHTAADARSPFSFSLAR